MKKYGVNVNGTMYEIAVEALGEGEVSAAAASAPAAAPVAVSAGAETVAAPMPGNILDVKVTAGQSVKSGDILMILEAMKMENEILAPKDGKVASVNVTKGQTVASGDVLCTVE